MRSENSSSPSSLNFEDLEEGMKVVEVITALSEDDPTIIPGTVAEIGEGESSLDQPGEGEAKFRHRNNSTSQAIFGSMAGAEYSRIKRQKMKNSENVSYYKLQDAEEEWG
jgi:hypothetical protein